MNPPLKITVLVSGTGTNLQALINARRANRLSMEIIHVISNVETAAGLTRAQEAGIPTSILEHGGYEHREHYDRALCVLMAMGAPDLIVLAGFMRIIGEPILTRYAGRMINLHPSLLPRHPGLDTYRKALDAGDRYHGASIHFVTGDLDAGPVLSQVRIPIVTDDSIDSLRRRLAPREHELVVATVELFEGHRVECADGRVSIDERYLAAPLQLNHKGKLAL